MDGERPPMGSPDKIEQTVEAAVERLRFFKKLYQDLIDLVNASTEEEKKRQEEKVDTAMERKEKTLTEEEKRKRTLTRVLQHHLLDLVLRFNKEDYAAKNFTDVVREMVTFLYGDAEEQDLEKPFFVPMLSWEFREGAAKLNEEQQQKLSEESTLSDTTDPILLEFLDGVILSFTIDMYHPPSEWGPGRGYRLQMQEVVLH